ncbi:MAG: hypothetical protein KF893_23020 [Caldilineaceae bacterium]|nr:hypothetical protein [Caldilineaceae bacterium]
MSHILRKYFGRSLIFSIFASLLIACGGGGQAQVEFGVKHLRDQTGEQIKEIVSFENESGLDNSSGLAPLQVQIQFERNYRHQIIERLQTNEISGQRVRDKIVELYKLPVHDPEGTIQKALCPVSVVIPAGQKARITVEWTERWAEGIINRGAQGDGDRLGNFTVFLGYIEPCSLVDQQNVN